MLKKISKLLIKFMPIIVLILAWLSILITNFTSNTWLSGWDNLHPEFNFVLNLKRSFSAAWQEYQGVGLAGGMAHAADLPRQIILWLVSFFLPANSFRYVWTFLMLLIGPLGVYFFIKKIFLRGKESVRNLSSLVAGLFYLFNLATVQYFFTPFETFVSFYGFFPWLLYFALKYLKLGKSRNLLWFFIISFLATPAFYVQTLFLVYVSVLFIFVLEAVIRGGEGVFLRSLRLALTLFVANAFWLLPVIYFSFTNTQIIQQSHINSIATVETQIMNEASGSLKDVASLKGFWFNYMDLAANNKFDYLYRVWIDYFNSHLYIGFYSYLLFGIGVLGLITALFQKKNKFRFSGLLVFLLVYFMLASTNPPFGEVFKVLSGKIPLFNEIFRSVFTKWSLIGAFSYSLGLALFIFTIGGFLKRLIIPMLLTLVLFSLMILPVKPIFEGKLISDTMQVKIPNEYFRTFEFFNEQPKEERIAFLPAQTFWGWNFYDWGYRGSGFLWYGLEQPILDRAFDVWSANNESFYNQLSFAAYTKNLDLFEGTLKKFEVSYLILDESVINAGGDKRILYLDEIKELISSSKHIEIVQDFGFLNIYKTDLGSGDSIWISGYTLIDADLVYSDRDPVYEEFGTYVYDENGLTFPFINYDSREKPEVIFTEDSLKILSKPLNFSDKKQLVAPTTSRGIGIKLNKNKQIEVTLPIDKKEDDFISRGLGDVKNCDLKEMGQVSKEIIGGKVFYRAEDGAATCDFYNYPELSLSEAFLLRIKGENLDGRGLKVYLQNWANNKIDFETLLPEGGFDEYFFVLPKDIDAFGYTLNLETRSYGRISSENVLEKIEIIPIPINTLRQIEVVPEDTISIHRDIVILEAEKIGTGLYSLKTNSKQGLVVLGQGYESGWLGFGFKDEVNFFEKALPWFSGNYLKHVKVNSWANGWYVPDGNQRVILIFWPQYLQYLGFALIIISSTCLLRP